MTLDDLISTAKQDVRTARLNEFSDGLHFVCLNLGHSGNDATSLKQSWSAPIYDRIVSVDVTKDKEWYKIKAVLKFVIAQVRSSSF
jgi:hypothetical protein